MKGGKPNYFGKPKLNPDDGLFDTAVAVGGKIQKTSFIMLLTACLYLIVQVPVFFHLGQKFPKHLKPMEIFDRQAEQVNLYALIGFVSCIVCFLGYLVYQYITVDSDENKNSTVRIEAIKTGKVTLRGVMHGLIEQRGNAGSFMDITEKEKNAMKDILKPFFLHYDNDNNGILSKYEFGKIMVDLKEDLTQEMEMKLFDSADVDKSGAIDFDEFCQLMVRYTKNEVANAATRKGSKRMLDGNEIQAALTNGGYSNGVVQNEDNAEEDDEGEEDDEEEIPDDLKDLTPEEQQRAIKVRACWMMGIGTLLVLVFSDPAVDVLSNIGTRLNVSAFYVSFILAPLASNASELVAAYNYGCKKTQSMMTISLSTLLGAGCMNNTFCLAIFFALIWYQKLTWNYTAETVSILFIQFFVGIVALKKVQSVMDACLVLCGYPLSLIIVYIMQNILGLP